MVTYARVSLEQSVTEDLRQLARDVSSKERRKVTITEIVRESMDLYISKNGVNNRENAAAEH